VILIILVIFETCFWNEVHAAQILSVIELPSSFNPVGSGARALGMGGAFIAVADDATAASWNPGGLVQLQRPEASVVYAFVRRTEDNTFGVEPVMSGAQPVENDNINYISASYPFTAANHNMIFSVNYQYLFDLHREWSLPFPISPTRTDSLKMTQEGGLGALGLAYAIQLGSQFSLGATVNSWCDLPKANTWENSVFQNGDSGTVFGAPVVFEGALYDKYEFTGLNLNLGLLWNIDSALTLGMVLKTPFTADISHGHSESSELRLKSDGTWLSGNEIPYAVVDEELDMPLSIGLGMAYRFSDALTVSADVYRTEWSDYIYRDANGAEFSPISSLPLSQSDIGPTHQVRAGMEYLIIDMDHEVVIPLRAGFFYDPSPAEKSPDDYYGFSLGSGIAYKSFIFDIAYQYRFGRGVGASYLEELGLSQDIDEHTVYSSLIYHF